MTSRSALKQFFLTSKKPTQGQFAELIDSLFHKGEDTVAIAMIAGLAEVLSGKASNAQVNGLVTQVGDLVSFIGNLNSLTTADKSSLVAAINELQADSGGIGADDLGQGLIVDSNGKLTLDLTSKMLLTPAISVLWTVYKADYTTQITTSAVAALVVDKGSKVDMVAKYKYSAPNDSQAIPTSAASSSFNTDLPLPDTFSAPLTVNAISANRADTISFFKAKSGLVVAGSQVAFPTGSDTTAASISLTFRGRGVVVTSFGDAALTATQIQSVLNGAAFVTSKAGSYSGVTASGGKYVYYLRDASLGRPTSVIQNGALPVFNAFQFLADVTITNAAGFQMPVTVMRSNDMDAFVNATLDFA
jgi:outer membrane murein-binding lipoprotein Lpp